MEFGFGSGASSFEQWDFYMPKFSSNLVMPESQNLTEFGSGASCSEDEMEYESGASCSEDESISSGFSKYKSTKKELKKKRELEVMQANISSKRMKAPVNNAITFKASSNMQYLSPHEKNSTYYIWFSLSKKHTHHSSNIPICL
ncbi:778_t:CDS:2 [Gigaspora rosea]|nr:778_t:CDS:2 [Gigaspora rosea]